MSEEKKIIQLPQGSKAIAFTAEEQVAVNKLNATRSFKKGAVLLREGQVNASTFYVFKGCLRQYYLHDGEEKTVNFYTDGQSVILSSQALSRRPSKYFLVCVEDSELTVTSQGQLDEFYKKFPRFHELCRITSEEELAEYQEQFALFMSATPEERVLSLSH